MLKMTLQLLPSATRSSSSLSRWACAVPLIWMIVLTSSQDSTDFRTDRSIDACSQSSINVNLRVFYRCHQGEFQEVISCGNERKSLSCPRGRYIAVHSALAGHSKASTNCVQTAITDETDCAVECVVNVVNELCLGKRKCQIGARDQLLRRPCRTPLGTQPEHRFLRLLYACVSKNVAKLFHNGTGGPQLDDDCQEVVETTTFSSPADDLGLPGTNGATPHSGGFSGSHAVTASGGDEVSSTRPNHNGTSDEAFPQSGAKTTLLPRPVNSKTTTDHQFTDSVNSTPTLTQQKIRTQNRSSSIYLDSMSETIWVFHYVSDNTEKFVIYFLLGFFLGIILFLLVLILRSVYLRRMSDRFQLPPVAARKTDSSNSLKWRSAESESSVDDYDLGATGLGHPGGRPWLHGRIPRTWSPPATSPGQAASAVNSTQREGRPNGTRAYDPGAEGDVTLNSDEAIPLQVGTQSLTRGQNPSLTNGNPHHYSDPRALTLQTASRQNYYR